MAPQSSAAQFDGHVEGSRCSWSIRIVIGAMLVRFGLLQRALEPGRWGPGTCRAVVAVAAKDHVGGGTTYIDSADGTLQHVCRRACAAAVR